MDAIRVHLGKISAASLTEKILCTEGRVGHQTIHRFPLVSNEAIVRVGLKETANGQFSVKTTIT